MIQCNVITTIKSAKDFSPWISPSKMLQLGVFEGKYLNDCWKELPNEWYEKAVRADTLSPEYPYVIYLV